MVVPVVTGFGEAAAAVATVGALLLTVTEPVPWRLEPESAAVTVKGPPAVPPAVKRPLESTVPPALTLHVKVGCDAIAAPNWSFRLAVNACVPFGATAADAGLTATLVACCCTGTTTELVTVTPSWSATVTWKV